MPGGSDSVGTRRVLTAPNVISVARLACVPVFLWLLLGAERRGAAAALLAGLGVTDWVDGWLARRLGQVSTLGKVLDPVADRVLVIGAVVGSLVDGAVPVWVGVAVGIREVLVSSAVIGLGLLGAPRIDVLWIGKAGTLCLMVSLPLFIVGSTSLWGHEAARVAAWVFVVPGLVLSWWAAGMYVPRARRAFTGRRHTSQAGLAG